MYLYFFLNKDRVQSTLTAAIKRTGVQEDPMGKRNYTGVQKVSQEDPRENLKKAIKSSILLSSSSSSNGGLELRLRGTCHLETQHR
jgi:hypothetical protein